jgi:hypothetical protein
MAHFASRSPVPDCWFLSELLKHFGIGSIQV